MKPVRDSAPALLLITGGLLGMIFPLGKIAGEAGVSPVIWSFVISFGVAATLVTVDAVRGGLRRPDAHSLRYFILAGTISYCIPNIIVFAAIPHLGAGFTAIMFTLSPVITLCFSILLKLRRPNGLGIAGITIGFAGALVVATTRGELGQPASAAWVALGLLIPVALALGNIYRTLDWPAHAGSLELAYGSHFAAAAVLVVVGAWSPWGFDPSPLVAVPLETLVQVLSSAGMFVFFFRLQVVGGPVYLSQMGYVAAALGLVSGMIFLGESYGLLTWVGAAIIAIGVGMTTRAQSQGS
ncbi:DMT family transporter [Aquibium carbonis]|uniref:DMT family transporter n=1 Tax=Aquibium carbonis TaxID=2495581 RepID=A0A3R9YSI8_9HYPH|nr:DMT family transporter [Aquibium carbonis]RST86125.1 DMT family transporter [Aquibium carbonis]